MSDYQSGKAMQSVNNLILNKIIRTNIFLANGIVQQFPVEGVLPPTLPVIGTTTETRV